MPTDTSIEKRLAVVEQELTVLKARIDNNGQSTNWIERFVEVFKDEPSNAEVIEYGRQFRESDRQQENA